MKTHEQNKNNKQMEIERSDWFIKWILLRVAFDWLLKRTLDQKTSCPRNFLKLVDTTGILTSYCKTVGQLNKAFSTLGFSLAAKKRVYVLIFSSVG